jgi:hypothetical protein
VGASRPLFAEDPSLSMLVEPPAPRRKRRPRWWVLSALAAAALGIHWMLLRSVTDAGDNAPFATMQVRAVEPAPAPVEVAAAPTPLAPPPPERRRPRVAPPVARHEAPAEPAAAPQPQVQPIAPAASPVVVASADAGIELAALAAPAAVSPAEPPPVYPTVMPPAVTLRYALRRGLWSGSGQLVWQPMGDHYEARLEGYVAGLRVLTQVSQGSFDHAGIAPLRYTDQRLRREVNAANFQRDKGKLTYSGPANEFPLVPGAQDRLSWMIQLAAVIAAEPQRAAPGGRVLMFVTGARADVDVWAFDFVEAEMVATDVGSVRTFKFMREPRKPYDTLVEVWLDPARHYLPVRAKLTSAPSGDALELLLRDMQ